MNEITVNNIESRIYLIRGQKVMIDSDLAELYGVPTKALNQAVKRNSERFPEDFMFKPNSRELSELRSQIVTAEELSNWKFNQFNPSLFTANGISMLSGVINSDRAIKVHIAIMRTFTNLKNIVVMEAELKKELKTMKDDTGKLFEIVYERLEDIENFLVPKIDPKRKKIGLKDTD